MCRPQVTGYGTWNVPTTFGSPPFLLKMVSRERHGAINHRSPTCEQRTRMSSVFAGASGFAGTGLSVHRGNAC